MTWNDFFKRRQTRRRFQLGSSVATSATGFVASVQAITLVDLDPILSQIPLDPFISTGLLTFVCAALGWLAGPSLGMALFNLRNGRVKEMEEKEKEFYRRIKKWRVDPSGSSVGNPVPGELGLRRLVAPRLTRHDRLLRREDREPGRVSALAERPTGLQSEASEFRVTRLPNRRGSAGCGRQAWEN